RVNFKSQSNIFIKSYELNLNSRIISKNKKILKLTEKEILVILFLFNANNPKNINDLQKEVWQQKLTLETHTVETHIYRLRQKFLKVFNDKFFILSERLGYSI
ncbi:winged helix-turn-helix domain-containing protein, partial [Candidatus Pelagibacter ubique]|nr:winged helix-turn-helix domain-containing protein [Candidatus Pelagibacter ubique]